MLRTSYKTRVCEEHAYRPSTTMLSYLQFTVLRLPAADHGEKGMNVLSVLTTLHRLLRHRMEDLASSSHSIESIALKHIIRCFSLVENRLDIPGKRANSSLRGTITHDFAPYLSVSTFAEYLDTHLAELEVPEPSLLQLYVLCLPNGTIYAFTLCARSYQFLFYLHCNRFPSVVEQLQKSNLCYRAKEGAVYAPLVIEFRLDSHVAMRWDPASWPTSAFTHKNDTSAVRFPYYVPFFHLIKAMISGDIPGEWWMKQQHNSNEGQKPSTQGEKGHQIGKAESSSAIVVQTDEIEDLIPAMEKEIQQCWALFLQSKINGDDSTEHFLEEKRAMDRETLFKDLHVDHPWLRLILTIEDYVLAQRCVAGQQQHQLTLTLSAVATVPQERIEHWLRSCGCCKREKHGKDCTVALIAPVSMGIMNKD